MLRVADYFADSDTGRARRANEDAFYAHAPVFAVADGMGGAQAGEVASRTVVDRLRRGLPDGGSPEERLALLAEEANDLIHRKAAEDEQRAGMGTTLTAAYVDEDAVSFGHVGDSRAYLFRDDKLQQLTNDHSLVGEMVRRGKLTAEQAEEHPQRSIITRALGPEPVVEVDHMTTFARDGDLFLLCSDGLTSMIGDDAIEAILRAGPDLATAGHALIDAANEAGGRDNITVILFRVEDVGGRGQTDQATVVGEDAPRAEDVRAAAAAAAAQDDHRHRHGRPAGGRDGADGAGAQAAAPARGHRPAPAPAQAAPAVRAGGRRRRRRRPPRGGVLGQSRRVLRRNGFPRRRDDLPRPPLRAALRAQALPALLQLRRGGGAGAEQPSAHVAGQRAALAQRCHRPGAPARNRAASMSARNRELFGLIPAALLLTGGFAAVFIQQQNVLSDVSLTYGGIFLGLCLAAHIFLRFTLPNADPYLFPLVALLACFGLVVIYRIDDTLAREQAQWFVVGLIAFAAVILFLRDYRVLERYRYTIAFIGLGLLVLPRLPGIGAQVNGAYLGIKIGPVTFQPAELAKICLVIFVASYLRDTRQVLVLGARRFMGVTIPPLKHFGPLLVIWGASMLMLVLIRDLGSSLMFFGGFLAMLYVATNRVSFVLVGLILFALGAWFLGSHIGHVHDRVETWLDPFRTALYNKPGGSYQIAQSLFAQADGGLIGTGFGQALLSLPNGTPILPAAHTDLIYAVITNELGLAGACGVLLVYLLFTERGLKIATLARDSFSSLLATGLTAVLALQVFVIVGGVTKVIPLTGVTLPFVSYGGSSIVANFILLALLLQISDRARRDRA